MFVSIAPVVTPRKVPRTGFWPIELLKIAQRNIEPSGHKQPPKKAHENRLAGAAAAICGRAHNHSPAPPPAERNRTSVMSLRGNNLK